MLIIAFLFWAINSFSGLSCKIVMQAEKVFQHLDEVQQVYQDHQFELCKATLKPELRSFFSHAVLATESLLQPASALCLTLQGKQYNQFESTMKLLYGYLDRDISAFLNWLNKNGYTDDANIVASGDQKQCIDQANLLMRLLFLGHHEKEQNELLFAVANRFYEFCFSEKTFPRLTRMFYDKRKQKLVKFLYGIMWLQLAGSGWRCWHQSCLDDLKLAAGEGKRIVYLAGGSDIAMLLRYGIYNITVIDPQLPSQPKYYASNWDFLISSDSSDGGLHDEIIFNKNDLGQKVIMVRKDFVKHDYEFSLPLSTGEKATLSYSTTTWSVCDQNNNELGTYILERRPLVQEDFKATEDTLFLMSLNELHFISKPPLLGGWGITPSGFDENFKLYIKQLRQPIKKGTIHNMRLAYLLNSSLLHFLELGTCVN